MQCKRGYVVLINLDFNTLRLKNYDHMIKLNSCCGSHKAIILKNVVAICNKNDQYLKNDEHMMNPNNCCGSHKTIFKRMRYM